MTFNSIKFLALVILLQFSAGALFSGISIVNNSLVVNRGNARISYAPVTGYQIDSFHPINDTDICVTGSFNSANYKNLEIIRISEDLRVSRVLTTEEFYLPEFTFSGESIEISHQIPLENYSHSSNPLRIITRITGSQGNYSQSLVEDTGEPVYTYYLAKKYFKILEFQKSYQHFKKFHEQCGNDSPLKEESIYYLCRLSSFYDLKQFLIYYEMLKKEFPGSEYLGMFEQDNPEPSIEKCVFLGTHFYMAGKFSESLKYTLEASGLAQSLKRPEYLPRIYYKLALLYEQSGKLFQARKLFLEVSCLTSDSIYVQFAREKLKELGQPNGSDSK